MPFKTANQRQRQNQNQANQQNRDHQNRDHPKNAFQDRKTSQNLKNTEDSTKTVMRKSANIKNRKSAQKSK